MGHRVGRPVTELDLGVVETDTPFPIVFTVNGIAAPQGSKNAIPIKNRAGTIVGTNVVESSKRVGPWRKRIAAAGEVAMYRYRAKPFAGAVRVHLRFVLPRPKATPAVTPPAIKKNGDIDKLARAVLDALTGPVLVDDCLVVELRCLKRIAEKGEEPRVIVTVARFP